MEEFYYEERKNFFVYNNRYFSSIFLFCICRFYGYNIRNLFLSKRGLLRNYSDSGFNFKSKSSTKSGQKTTYYKSSSGVTLWSVTVKASFSYTYGKSSTCTSVTGSSASSSVAWKVSSASSKKNGNTATASATGYHYTNGALVESLSRSVSLSCDIYGSLS